MIGRRVECAYCTAAGFDICSSFSIVFEFGFVGSIFFSLHSISSLPQCLFEYITWHHACIACLRATRCKSSEDPCKANSHAPYECQHHDHVCDHRNLSSVCRPGGLHQNESTSLTERPHFGPNPPYSLCDHSQDHYIRRPRYACNHPIL